MALGKWIYRSKSDGKITGAPLDLDEMLGKAQQGGGTTWTEQSFSDYYRSNGWVPEGEGAPAEGGGGGGAGPTGGGGGAGGPSGGAGGPSLGLAAAAPAPAGGGPSTGFRESLGMRQPPPLAGPLAGLKRIY